LTVLELLQFDWWHSAETVQVTPLRRTLASSPYNRMR